MEQSILVRPGTKDVTAVFRKKIISGEWPCDKSVPSIRTLARQYNTSSQTVQNAMRLIEAEGLIVCRSNRPAVVVNAAPNKQKDMLPSVVATKQVGVLALGYTNSHLTMDDIITDPKRDAETWSLQIFAAIRDELFKCGYDLVVMPLSDQGDCHDELIRRNLSGYLFVGQPRFERLRESLSKAGIPWICLVGVGKEDNHNVVHANNFAGGCKVGEVFVRLGYNKILVIGANTETSAQKTTGLFNAFIRSEKDTGNLKVVYVTDVKEYSGYECTKKYIQQFGPPDGIFAFGDLLAKGACSACAEAGLEVGKDVGVVGGTGLESSAHYHPSLSVLKQPMLEMGQGAARMLIDMIDKKQVIVPSCGFSSQLIIRDSLVVPDEAKADIEKIISE